jgi:plastocyanin
MKISRRAKVLLFSISAPLLFLVAFTIVVVSYSHFHTPPEVGVTTTGFTRQTITVPAGATIHFVNKSSSMTQVLCLGTDAHCESTVFLSPMQAPPPRDLLSPGVRLSPAQGKDVVFDTEGTFHVTSALVPGMNLTVTVTATS